MKKYFLNKNNIKRILLTGLKYGAIVGLVTIAFRYILMLMTDRIQGNILVLILAGLILIGGQYYAFKFFNEKHKNQQLKFLPTLVVGLIFSLCLGSMAGLAHFIEATYIDPEWSIKSLEYAKETWLQSNYSETAISNQVEWTSTFQTPSLWAFEIMKFLVVLSFAMALMVISFMKVLEETSLIGQLAVKQRI